MIWSMAEEKMKWIDIGTDIACRLGGLMTMRLTLAMAASASLVIGS